MHIFCPTLEHLVKVPCSTAYDFFLLSTVLSTENYLLWATVQLHWIFTNLDICFEISMFATAEPVTEKALAVPEMHIFWCCLAPFHFPDSCCFLASFFFFIFLILTLLSCICLHCHLIWLSVGWSRRSVYFLQTFSAAIKSHIHLALLWFFRNCFEIIWKLFIQSESGNAS